GRDDGGREQYLLILVIILERGTFRGRRWGDGPRRGEEAGGVEVSGRRRGRAGGGRHRGEELRRRTGRGGRRGGRRRPGPRGGRAGGGEGCGLAAGRGRGAGQGSCPWRYRSSVGSRWATSTTACHRDCKLAR